jgi:hypothetical protein
MFQTKFVNEIKNQILGSVIFFFEIRAVYEVKSKNIVQWGRPQTTIWRMRIEWWIPKGCKYTHSGCVILPALPQPTMVARTHLYVTLYVHCLSGITLIKGSEIAKRTERFTTAVTNYLQHTGTVLSPQIWKKHAKYFPYLYSTPRFGHRGKTL